jgi:hypothetical protein
MRIVEPPIGQRVKDDRGSIGDRSGRALAVRLAGSLDYATKMDRVENLQCAM